MIIVGFGSTYYKVFPMSAPYNEDTFERAKNAVSQIAANRGGTEILKPLEHILSVPAYDRYLHLII